jgi:hypothetical protein
LGQEGELVKVRFVVLFVVSWLACASDVVQKAPIRIPFTHSEGGQLMVSGSAGPGTQYSFVLDTGAGVSVLSKSLVEKLGGKPAGQFTGFRMTGERLDMQLYAIPELRVGPVVQAPALVAAWDVPDKALIVSVK